MPPGPTPPNPVNARNRISLSSGAGDTHSPVAWIVAVSLHAAVIAATLFTFSHTLEIADVSTPTVPVDLVTVSNKTNVMAMQKRTPKAPPAVTPAPPTPTPVPTPTPAPAQAAEPAPAKPDVAARAEPAPLPKAKPLQPTQTKPLTADQQMAALLNKLAAPAAAPRTVKTGDRTVKGVGDMNAMTADLKSALQSQIAQCWSPPVGAPHPEQLVVNYELFLNQDGSVAQPPQLAANSAAAEQGNPFMRAAVESARRAIYTCAPYKLPADRYGQWRDITFTFNPADMVGAQ
jgi:hypothetical protein